MLTLRPYQDRALNELYGWLDRHPEGNPIVNMCVGAGKSVVIAELCRRAIEQYPQTRIVMTVASRELCQQNLEKLLMIWPDAATAKLAARVTTGSAVSFSAGSLVVKPASRLSLR